MSSTYLIDPDETVRIYYKATPIIPEVAENLIVTNNSNIDLLVVSYWAPPSNEWVELGKHDLTPYDTILVNASNSSFYYYTVVVKNNNDKTTASVIVETLNNQ